MFYIIEVEDYVRVEPKLFGLSTKEAIEKQLLASYADYQDREIGAVIAVVEVLEVGDGIIIPGDGAAYYNSRFKLLISKPELQELAYGIVDEIANFGAFMNLGVLKGMMHISQTMDDYVNFSKSGTLVGKSGKKSLHKEDLCIARIVAISHKGEEFKIGLTMRQPGLGKLEWIQDDKRRAKLGMKKVEKEEKEKSKKEKKKK